MAGCMLEFVENFVKGEQNSAAEDIANGMMALEQAWVVKDDLEVILLTCHLRLLLGRLLLKQSQFDIDDRQVNDNVNVVQWHV